MATQHQEKSGRQVVRKFSLYFLAIQQGFKFKWSWLSVAEPTHTPLSSCMTICCSEPVIAIVTVMPARLMTPV
ncbi:MAG: hypothetical protein KKD01_09650 [Proteobacteria bacterium]|nr:hypothetical protein [Pseudomonadota bacterium]MBU1138723.1 hypothetical protein [Pseudomonadota bacterium]MBU1233591.1 hypothetical protein [Pseudomonadota bacterium]MBU1420592.1 hypothetical protein [Pseudomonadota bacterium]MBU1454975.1 hypothetical protein [Pseudomonadota bacterium]